MALPLTSVKALPSERVLPGLLKSILPSCLRATSTIAFSCRQTLSPAIASSWKRKEMKRLYPKVSRDGYDERNGDAFEALFDTLEEDLQSDGSIVDDDLSEEEHNKLQHEWGKALGVGDGDDDDDIEMFNTPGDHGDDSDSNENDEENKEGSSMKLKTWQLRRLASALKVGRRKISIKSLAAEICLERAVVLQLLRDPPPNLVLMSAALTNKPSPPSILESKSIETAPTSTRQEVKSESEVKVPIHVMRNRWSVQKRLKMAQVYTLERVYQRTKRPTNSMIDSIVHVTNLPRKRVVQWFEEKRNEDGVPSQRARYQRSATNNVPTC
ncbi:hypothetical protein K2173_025945 [Erythroxylum novogranatense]|uniref:Homeobox domain-containing protein n=1 Tax=Erythroxylum novogranatense TaxID=1862640 RepID=A0AAV8SI63_9ROSI|nr:hypothetical protein K2173_025945 [Erythroxylum novogranatense]